MFFISIIISIITISAIASWEWIKENVELFAGLATALAFIATAWSAREARRSAKVAFLALGVSESTLKETQRNYRIDAFNQRFSLLLDQHNTYLEKVNKYIKSELGWPLMQELFNYNRSSESTNPLSGHIILSPYMRVLYHTLKFIDEDYFEKEDKIFGRKKYTSLIRSLISNDILFLIAVNSSYIYKKGEYNQYSRYQQLLQKYDFFEHADFFSIKHDSDPDKNLLIKEQLKETENQMGICFTNYINQEGINLMSELEFTLRQPEFIAYIYKNPRQKVVRSWFNLAPWKALEILSKRTENRGYKDIFVDRFLSEYIGRYMVYSTPALFNRFNEESKTPITYTILKSIARAVKSGRIKQSETSILRFAQVNEESRYVEKYSRYQSLYETVKDYNTFINRKNDILFGRRYEPLKLMVKKINCFEKTVLTQRYL